jgi:hypothetical protein
MTARCGCLGESHREDEVDRDNGKTTTYPGIYVDDCGSTAALSCCSVDDVRCYNRCVS